MRVLTTYPSLSRLALAYVHETPDDPPPDDPNKTKPLSLTQEELDQIITDRLAQDRRSRGGGMSAKEKEELERLRKVEEDRKRKEAEDRGNYEAALKSKDEEFAKERETLSKTAGELLNELKRDRCVGAVISAAAKARAVNPQSIAKLLEDRVQLDDNRQVVVLDEGGRPWFKGGKPATVEMLIEAHAKENPWAYLADGDGGGGADSRGGKGTGDGDASADTKEILELEAALKEARKKAMESGSPADVNESRKIARKLEEARKKKDGK